MRVPAMALAGLGVSTTPGVIPYPGAGTTNDPNCGWECDIPFYRLGAQCCWPCANICPPGTQWDTTNCVCSQTPESVADGTAPTPGTAATPTGCPDGQTWNSDDAQCEASCTGPLCAVGISGTTTAIIGGLVLALVAVALVSRL